MTDATRSGMRASTVDAVPTRADARGRRAGARAHRVATVAAAATAAPVQHGGPDERGIVRFDFSTNANACAPLPSVLRAVECADRTRYPDPSYRALREQLAEWHDVEPVRIVIGASASELIHRLTRASAAAGARRVLLPNPGYGDYAAAALLAGLATVARSTFRDVPQQRNHRAAVPPQAVPSAGDLYWITEPMTPTGSTMGRALIASIERAVDAGAVVALDLAYQPLRLDGAGLVPRADAAWQLWSPNKACGLTGVRAAYAIAPSGGDALALRAHAPSWAAGADGVAMLSAFATPAVRDELYGQLPRLRAWRDDLATMLRGVGWHVRDAASVTPFFVAQPPAGIDAEALRAHGVRVRDTTSMGLPGWLRLSAQPPAALLALRKACRRLARERAR